MLKVISHKVLKTSQRHYYDDLNEGVDWGGDDDMSTPWDDYLVDNAEGEQPDEFDTDNMGLEQSPELLQPGINPPQEMLPDGQELEPEEQEISTVEELLSKSMGEPPHLIKIDYTTIDGRFTPDRIVEPHRTYVAATTGNNILLTYDHSVGDIRGFVIGRIKPFGVLYRNTFHRKPEIMRERAPRMKVIQKRR